MPSSLAWLTAPLLRLHQSRFRRRNHALPPPSVSQSLPDARLRRRLSPLPPSQPPRPPSRPQQRPSLRPPPSSCDAPPHPLGWLHQEPLRGPGGEKRGRQPRPKKDAEKPEALPGKRNRDDHDDLPPPPKRQVSMIMGGFLDNDDSISAIKEYERKAVTAQRYPYIHKGIPTSPLRIRMRAGWTSLTSTHS
ncbi:unnamed protein product [Microthlaspi erraticum]|uniref:Uncharacterized protein n=1 Tax=Microthlaspi erraticum TaxID=1685480 RepID=A0A6D2HNQ7_9BRAS|nr:unnamed protein product [Microthlaspi erraticum]